MRIMHSKSQRFFNQRMHKAEICIVLEYLAFRYYTIKYNKYLHSKIFIVFVIRTYIPFMCAHVKISEVVILQSRI